MTPFFLLQPFSVLPAADLNCYNLQLGRLVGSLHITFRKERLAEILHKTWDAWNPHVYCRCFVSNMEVAVVS